MTSPIAAGDDILIEHHDIDQQSYTPSLLAATTDPTLGTGSTVNGRYWRDPISGRVWGGGLIRFGTSGTNAGSGNYFITLPTAHMSGLSLLDTIGLAPVLGTVTLRDNSATATSVHGVLVLRSADGGTGGVATANVMLLNGTAAQATHAAPWAWSTEDGISFWFDYVSPIT